MRTSTLTRLFHYLLTGMAPSSSATATPPSFSSSSSSSSPTALLASLQDELRRIDEDVARSLVKVDNAMETWREGLEKVIG